MRPSSDSQHARILVAINTIAGRKGVTKTSVADVVKEAGVSRTTFYELFRSKEECFIESFVYSTDLLREITRAAVVPELSDWRVAMRRGVQAHLGALASSPEFARANLIEIQNVGDHGHAKRNEVIANFSLTYERLFEIAVGQEQGHVVPSKEALFSLVAGLDQLQCLYIREGRVSELPTLEDTLFDFSASVFLGAVQR
jgi:AcrR family transcriptional regulator